MDNSLRNKLPMQKLNRSGFITTDYSGLKRIRRESYIPGTPS